MEINKEQNKEKDFITGMIRNELNYSNLILESEMQCGESYQLEMIKENDIRGVLKVIECGKDSGSQYIYDVSGKISLQRKYEKLIWDKGTIRDFLQQFMNVITELNHYMLDVNCILLEPQFIFCSGDSYYFCYYPAQQKYLSQSFHEFTEYLVKAIDYSDYQSVIFVCDLHKESMEEQYSLEALIEEYTKPGILQPEYMGQNNFMESEVEENQAKEEKLAYGVEEKGSEHYRKNRKRSRGKREDDLGKNAEEEQGWGDKSLGIKSILRETPMKRYWNQKKKEKWGEWDDLLTQEESFIIDKKR